jgi:S-formylglutathione hydrolase FrmB
VRAFDSCSSNGGVSTWTQHDHQEMEREGRNQNSREVSVLVLWNSHQGCSIDCGPNKIVRAAAIQTTTHAWLRFQCGGGRRHQQQQDAGAHSHAGALQQLRLLF